ncbi:MAG TPA: hypothetical protein VFO56_05300 [Gaiellaceae bacterium]|nr:hypothetical protein [Gaiellaceae bacterium]
MGPRSRLAVTALFATVAFVVVPFARAGPVKEQTPAAKFAPVVRLVAHAEENARERAVVPARRQPH